MEQPPIQDYALLADCHSTALVSRDGSVDWCCLHRFDQRPVFTRLLDWEKGGHFRIAPVEPARVTRAYRPGGFVLETRFETDGGVLLVTDVLVHVRDDPDAPEDPPMELLRELRCEAGEVEVDVVLRPRFEYALVVPRVRREGDLLVVYGGSAALVVESDAELVNGDQADLVARPRLRRGEQRYVRLHSSQPHRVVAERIGPRRVRRRIRDTEEYWREWSERCSYRGRYHGAVVRSALVLKALTNWPTGAVVAAPTTSLPEAPGGERNWDYRFTWLRDSDLHLDALFRLGYRDEGQAYMEWLKRTTAGRAADLQVCYGVGGERLLPEIELPHLAGYRGARPVRLGNGAAHQFQLGNYGHVLESAWDYHTHGGEIDEDFWAFLRDVVQETERRWTEPDHGIWEVRTEPRHFVTSKVMAWVAVRRGVQLAEDLGFGADLERWRELCGTIHREIDERGFDPRTKAMLREYGSSDLDASVLLAFLYRFLPPDDERIGATLDALQEGLCRGGLVHRYQAEDGLPGTEGAFFAASCWMVMAQAYAGRLEAARARFEELLSYQNDVGLLAEEIHAESRDHLGNFPQALSHIGLIHAALAVEDGAEETARAVS